MPILEECAEIIRDEIKSEIPSKLKLQWRLHGVYQRGKNAGKLWTARDDYMEMLKTVRFVKKGDGTRNIWVMAGNFKTWWAVQMEYGHGKWRGGARPFFRTGLMKSLPKIKALLASRKII